MKACLTMICLLASFANIAATEGQPAPELSLAELNSAATYELSDLRGKVVYLDFWASWCAPCRVSFPEIIQLKQDLADQPFEVIAVTVDENPEDAQRFLRRYEVPYPILHDKEGRSAATYRLPGMPTSFVIDGNGKIQLRHTGFKPGDMEAIRETIVDLLSGDES